MAKMKKTTRIKREYDKLMEVYGDLPEDALKTVAGLIDRSATLRVMLEDMEEDILENGTTEPFSQSSNLDPYDRERPVVAQYNRFLSNYRQIQKELLGLLPNAKVEDESMDDGFDSFSKAFD